MRRCTIPPASCRHQYTTPCCRDCRDIECKSRCQNDPARCHCWEDQPSAKRRGRLTKLDRVEISRLYDQGLLQRDIAERLGCSKSAVSAVLREKGGGKRARS